MKRILVVLDGVIAKKLISRMLEVNAISNSYDIVYMDDTIVPSKIPHNFLFYKFDPTSLSKLLTVINKNNHNEVMISLATKEETVSTIENIRYKNNSIPITILNNWELDFDDPNINIYNGIDVLSNGLLEKLPNIPVIAQNIGLREGEIMEMKIPFGSSYAYRYINSIEQKEWKIFGLYRNNKLVMLKKNLILKPNDTILIIGKPQVLTQVYKSMTIPKGQFPMPFGYNIYLYFDLILQEESDVLRSLYEAIEVNKTLQNKSMYIRIARPTNVHILRKIYDKVNIYDNIYIEIDYYNKGFDTLIPNDIQNYDIGLIIIDYKMFKYKDAMKSLYDIRIPILKLGYESFKHIQNISIFLNDPNSYEQISPIVFDIATQINTKINIFDYNPIEDKVFKNELETHFVNLGKIFNKQILIVKDNKNPIRELKKQSETIQILPLKKDMFNHRMFKLFNTDSDMLSFDINKHNQILIPIVEE
jgi:uncharacterized protein